MNREMRIITIDGPVASGKSTIARELARSLGFYYLYSGLWYRALAYCWLQQHALAQMDARAVQTWMAHADDLGLSYTVDSMGYDHMLMHDQDITRLLHSASIDEAASCLSLYASVRAWINSKLHQIAADRHIVADGRDMGAEVFATADLKIFLTADVAVRAERWRIKQAKQGNVYTQAEAEANVHERDTRDTHREVAPLIAADAAHTIYNNGNDPRAVVQIIRELFTL